MSRFRTFLDKIWNRIRDFAQDRDFYRSQIDHYHIGGDEIGISKEYGLLDYKTDLKDPKDWTGKKVYTEPETGEDEIYGFIPTQRREYSRTPFKSTKPGYQPGVRESYSGGGQGSVQSGLVIINGTIQRRETELREVPTNVFGETVYQKSRFNISQSTGIVKPLGSPGISEATSRETTFNSLGDDKLTITEAFDTDSNRYVKDTSVVPSWFRESNNKENVGRNKSKVAPQRDISRVQVMSDWAGEEPKKTYLADNSSHYEFATRFEREKVPTIKTRSVGNRVPTVNPFTVETSLPRDEIATLFYQKYLKENGYPGGQEVKNLEYNKAYEEALGLIPFCITTITPDHRTYLNFQANLDSYSDNYTGDWDSAQYVGRAEKFWGYMGFSRNIDISFKIAIARHSDCEEMYHRLNRLAGATAPSYDKSGLFMRGTLASLTIGDLLKHKAGIINNLKITWQQDYPWEVRESERSNIPAGDFMVPYVLDISLQFTPIEEKTVSEDNGDYFVFRSKSSTVPKRIEESEQKLPERSPETGIQDIRSKLEQGLNKQTLSQREHTAVAIMGNVEGGGGGTGASNRIALAMREQAKLEQPPSGLIQKTPEAERIEEAILNGRTPSIVEEGTGYSGGNRSGGR